MSGWASKFDESYTPEPNTGCWLWLGMLKNGGYGSLKIGGKEVGAHRYSYERHVGLIPSGLVLDHTCRVKSCVNPAHLEPVTIKVNVQRGYWGTAGIPPVVEAERETCRRGHPYTQENAYRNPRGQLDCRACRKIADDKRASKRREP